VWINYFMVCSLFLVSDDLAGLLTDACASVAPGVQET
jgi:hypothetical protein